MVAPYPAPQPYPQPPPGNGLAVAGMVLGIIGLVLCWIPFLGWLCALIGVILGALGMGKAKRIGGRGKGAAIAGLVCGLVGLVAGVILFILATIAVKSFETYVEKSRRGEQTLQLRSLEHKVKAFYIEREQLPRSAPEMPGPIGSMCEKSGSKFAPVPRSAWTEGWEDIGFSIDESSSCSYQLLVLSPTEARAIARCDRDCDGVTSDTVVTFTAAGGILTATRSEPTPD